MAICFALQGGTTLLIFVVALTITDTNYGKEDTVVAPKDLARAVGEKNAAHAGPGVRDRSGNIATRDDHEMTVGQVSDVHDDDATRVESNKKW